MSGMLTELSERDLHDAVREWAEKRNPSFRATRASVEIDDYLDPDDDEIEEDDPLEEALSMCGQSRFYSGCTLSGSEYCDWDCPFNPVRKKKHA
jgi:hypothetical protein